MGNRGKLPRLRPFLHLASLKWLKCIVLNVNPIALDVTVRLSTVYVAFTVLCQIVSIQSVIQNC